MTFRGCGASGATAVDATLHVENLFRDASGALAFELIFSADGADGSSLDGTVTLAELEARSLAAETRYQITGQTLPDLRAFIAHQVTTIGHVNGDERCTDVTAAP